MLCNSFGFVILVLGFVFAAGMAWLGGAYPQGIMYVWGATMMTSDLALRWKKDRRFLSPFGGAWVWFVPVWFVGFVVLMLRFAGYLRFD